MGLKCGHHQCHPSEPPLVLYVCRIVAQEGLTNLLHILHRHCTEIVLYFGNDQRSIIVRVNEL